MRSVSVQQAVAAAVIMKWGRDGKQRAVSNPSTRFPELYTNSNILGKRPLSFE